MTKQEYESYKAQNLELFRNMSLNEIEHKLLIDGIAFEYPEYEEQTPYYQMLETYKNVS